MCPPGFTGTRCEQGKEDRELGARQERLPGWGKTLGPRGWSLVSSENARWVPDPEAHTLCF